MSYEDDLILNLNFDGALSRISRDVEGFHCFLQRESMCDERLQVDETTSYQPDSFGVLQMLKENKKRKENTQGSGESRY